MKWFFTSLAVMATLQPVAASPRDDFLREATAWLLNGDAMPSDIDHRLMQLEPSDRVEALVFLRRSGLLTTQAWPVDRMLAPAVKSGRSK